jgi:hypothetical protein
MLEPGEVTGIVNAVTDAYDPIVGGITERVHSLELRVANIEPRVNGGQMATDDGRLAAVEQGLTTLAAYYEQMRMAVGEQSTALLHVLAGGADADVWREYVTRQMVALGVPVSEYAAMVRDAKKAAGQDELPLEGEGL